MNKERQPENMIYTVLSDFNPCITHWKGLSQKYPNLFFNASSTDASSVNIDEILNSITINNTQNNIKNNNSILCRTLYGSLHHFHPNLVKKIMKDTIQSNDIFLAAELSLNRLNFIDYIKWPLIMTILSPLMISQTIYEISTNDTINLSHKCQDIIQFILLIPFWLTAFIHDAIVSNVRQYTCNELINIGEQMKTELNKKYEIQCWNQKSQMMFPFNMLLEIKFVLVAPKT